MYQLLSVQRLQIRNAEVVFNHKTNIYLQVAWIKSDSKAILAIHTLMVALNPRLSVTHNGHNTWKLHISHVQLNDSGTYMCQGILNIMNRTVFHVNLTFFSYSFN